MRRILGKRAERVDEIVDAALGHSPGSSSTCGPRGYSHGPKPDLACLEESAWDRDLEAAPAVPELQGGCGTGAWKRRPRRVKTGLEKCFVAEMKRIQELRLQFPGFTERLIDDLSFGRSPSAAAFADLGLGGDSGPLPGRVSRGALLPMTAREPVLAGHAGPHSGHAGHTGQAGQAGPGGHAGGQGGTPRRPCRASPPPHHAAAPQPGEPAAKPAKPLLPTAPGAAAGADAHARQRKRKARISHPQSARSGSKTASPRQETRQYGQTLFFPSEDSPSRRHSRATTCSHRSSRTMVEDVQDEEQPSIGYASSSNLSEAASVAAGALDAVLAERARAKAQARAAAPASSEQKAPREAAEEEEWPPRPKQEKRGPALRRTTDLVLSIQRWLRTGAVGERPVPAHAVGVAGQAVAARAENAPEPRRRASAEARAAEPEEPRQLHLLSAQHHCPLFAVREAWQEFSAYKAPGISCEDFLELLRRRAHLPDGAPIPAHLMGTLSLEDVAKRDCLDFETYLEWSISVGWTEEMQVGSYEELEVRRIAREVNMPILDVEKVKTLFDQFDRDRSGMIDEEEFRHIVYKLWRVEDVSDVPIKTLRRIWRQIDQDGSGSIDFQEFLVWYSNFKQFGHRLNMI